MIGTGSTGASLLFWFAGIPYCLAGAHVYVEYGLNVPRYVIDGVEQSVPRSGGDLHYVSLLLSSPRQLRARADKPLAVAIRVPKAAVQTRHGAADWLPLRHQLHLRWQVCNFTSFLLPPF